MRPSLFILGFASAALASPGFLKLTLQTEENVRLHKRQASSNDLAQKILAGEKKNLYWLNLTVGTPAQSFRLQLDTGSSDIVLVNSQVSACSKTGGCPSGSFTPSDSSTYEPVSKGTFDDEYGDGTGYIGDWFTDVIDVGGIQVKQGNMAMGLANKLQDGPQLVNDGTGLVGIGHQALSGYAAISVPQQNTLPPTLVSAMVASGDIARQAYSLLLGSQESGEGSVIFGGVDPSLYTGDLISVAMVPSPNEIANYTRSIVPLTDVSVTDLDGERSLASTSLPIPVLLDSGATISFLPSDLMSSINAGLGVTVVQGNSYLPCTRAHANITLDFRFGGPSGALIKVPLTALMTPLAADKAEQQMYDDGQNACQLKLESSVPGRRVVLGDSFLRSGYFVYDLENNQIAMAQAAASPSSGSVTAIPSGTEIPGCKSTVTFSEDLSLSTASVDSLLPGEETTSVALSGSVLPATATFDLGSVSTMTANEQPSVTGGASGSGSGGASGSSSSGAAMPAVTVMAGLERLALAVAVVGGIAVL